MAENNKGKLAQSASIELQKAVFEAEFNFNLRNYFVHVGAGFPKNDLGTILRAEVTELKEGDVIWPMQEESVQKSQNHNLRVVRLLKRWAHRGKDNRAPTRGFFRFIELSSRLLPAKVRIESFEPAYHDEKAAFLKDRGRYKSKSARRWLAFCFAMHVALMVAQCGWGMFGDKLRRLLLAFLPDAFRKLLGG